MPAFYAWLDTTRFADVVPEMQALIDGSSMPGLPATRILDTLLMARGGRRLPEVEAQGFLACLPEQARGDVTDLAGRLQHQFGEAVLPTPVLRMKGCHGA